MDTFDSAWTMCAAKGMCDALGSVEYKRCRAFWERIGHTVKCLEFINEVANRPSPAVEQIADGKDGAP